MTPQIVLKNNKKLKDVKQIAYINYQLALNDYTQRMIAQDLGISPQAVYRVIAGQSASRRVMNWLEKNIGYKES